MERFKTTPRPPYPFYMFNIDALKTIFDTYVINQHIQIGKIYIFFNIIIYQHVSVAFATITRVSCKNTNNTQTIAQHVWLKPPDATVNINYNFNRNILLIINIRWNILYRCVFVGPIPIVCVKYNNNNNNNNNNTLPTGWSFN